MSRNLTWVLCLGVLGCSATPAWAQTDAEINTAVERGTKYLKSRQAADGRFEDHWTGKDYKTGETALALLTLLKAGVEPKDRRIRAGFAWLLAQPIRRIYEVSVAILALEARYTPKSKASIVDPNPLTTQVRKRFRKKASPQDRRWLTQAVAFLVKHQHPSGLWRYPFFGEADVSNAQFAILALQAAQRLGIKVSPEVYLKTAVGMVDLQEQQGPEVPRFSVPAADGAIRGLLDRREKARRAKNKRNRGRETLARRIESTERGPFHARGWGYKEGQGPRGSMTAAGLAMLVVCKSELEQNRFYQRKLAPKVDRALRDGAAWIASRFAADKNPGAEPDWLFYYLYTLERAGTLLALETFGPHDWYREGARVILGRQQGDGRFESKTSGESDGTLAGTCLAILFLKRSTVPVLKRQITGSPRRATPKAGGPVVERRADGSVQVTFRFSASPGRRVTVAGSFNAWNKDATTLRDLGNGSYEVTIPVPRGSHQYKFVVDGTSWHTDPRNPNQAPDGHGGHNSIVDA